jgi:hypothetical protein
MANRHKSILKGEPLKGVGWGQRLLLLGVVLLLLFVIFLPTIKSAVNTTARGAMTDNCKSLCASVPVVGSALPCNQTCYDQFKDWVIWK